MKAIKFIIIASIILSLPVSAKAANVQNYIKQTYNRYSKYFDQTNWTYNQPNYSLLNKKSQSARELAMISSYYKYTTNNPKTNKKIKTKIKKAYLEIEARPIYTQSFEDSIAHFLITRYAKILPKKFKKNFYIQIEKSLPGRISVNDTENRKLIAAVLDSYLAEYLYQRKKIDKKNYEDLIFANKAKLEQGIGQCIDENNWYFESKHKYFSAHYHILSAYLLMFYGDYFNQPQYLQIAKKMTLNIRKMTFKNGFIEAKIGMRPIGLGAQSYLMLGLLNKRFNFSDYNVYLNFTKNRFFSDQKNPNRLEFHSTLIDTAPQYNDDIGFSLPAELSKLDKIIKKTPFKNQPNQIFLKNKDCQNNRFTIQNNGEIIIINNKQYQLATNGEYSKILTIKK